MLGLLNVKTVEKVHLKFIPLQACCLSLLKKKLVGVKQVAGLPIVLRIHSARTVGVAHPPPAVFAALPGSPEEVRAVLRCTRSFGCPLQLGV